MERGGGERVIEEFRARMEEKKQEAAAGRWSPPNISEQSWQRMKTAAAVGVAAVLVISMISYRQQLRQLEETVSNYVALEAGTGAEMEVDATVSTMEESSGSGTGQADLSATSAADIRQENETEDAAAEVYHVEYGETLSQICLRIYGNLDLLQELCELNDIRDPDTILDGQVLILP